MKPSFALNLSHEGIGLLHRTPGGWHHVGDAKLDDPSLTETLGFLRQTAVGLEPGGITAKLVIPNSQILYHEISDAPGDGIGVESHIRAVLDGLTPYGVEELTFDWLHSEGRIQIAAVAHETLEEAESFAVEHKFNPVSFVAIPEEGQFDGEPFFGVTNASHGFLAAMEVVERDAFAIKIVPRPDAPKDEATPEAPDAPEEFAADQAEESLVDANDAEAEIEAEENDSKAGSTSTGADIPRDLETPAPSGQATDTTEPTTPDEPAPSFSTRRESRPSLTLGGNVTALPASRLSVGSASSPHGVAPRLGGAIAASGVTAPVAPDLPPAPQPAETQRISPVVAPGIDAETDLAPPPPANTEAEPSVPLAPAPDEAEAGSEAEALTVFGARKSSQKGKPRYLGLILTVVLILMMAALAIWSTFFLDDGLSGLFGPREREADPIRANLSEPAAPVIDEPLVAVVPPEPVPESDGGDLATAVLAPEPEPVAPMTREEAEAAYAETGIWQRAADPLNSPREHELNDIYVASADPAIVSHDALALPAFDPNPGLTRLPDQFDPAPSGTTYALDERGFVIPTDEGAMNPDGIMVFAGRPPGATPVRPRNAAVPGTAELDGVQLAALASYRPSPRPGNLQEIHERGLYSGLTRAELAAFRPLARPDSPQTAPEVDQTPTEFAVVQSVIPPRRPGNMDEIVAAAQSNPVNEEIRTASAAATGTAVAVGRVPDIPTRASVARAATQPNAINLRQISLIGVYGTSSDRRALIRLRNGRYVKVEVGDRVDGGRVAAIGDNSLQYVKGGRNVTLAMPDT